MCTDYLSKRFKYIILTNTLDLINLIVFKLKNKSKEQIKVNYAYDAYLHLYTCPVLTD